MRLRFALKRGSIVSYERSAVICRLTSTHGTQRVLRLSVYHRPKGTVSRERWSVNLSYAVNRAPATDMFRGSGSSVPGVGNVFGKV